MQSSLFKKIIIFLSITAFLLFGAIYFVYAEIRDKSEKIAMADNDLSQKNNRYNYLVSMQKLVSDIEPEIEKINNSIILRTGDVAFIENLEGLARSYDLSVQIESLNLVSDPKSSSSTPATLRIKAKTIGSWANSYLFLSELESLPFKIKVNKFAFQISKDIPKDGKSLPNNIWETSFEISVLKYK